MARISKITVDLDKSLLERARRSAGTLTMRETIDIALRSLSAQGERERLRLELGTFDLSLTRAELLRARRGR